MLKASEFFCFWFVPFSYFGLFYFLLFVIVRFFSAYNAGTQTHNIKHVSLVFKNLYLMRFYLACAMCLTLSPSSGSSSSSAGWMSIRRSAIRTPRGSGSSITGAPLLLACMYALKTIKKHFFNEIIRFVE